MQRILIAVTSCERQGNNGMFTGYDLPEVSHPYLVFRDYGYEVEFVSPGGGNPPIERYTLSDPISRAFLEDEDAQQRIRRSRRPDQVSSGEIAALYLAGGHGAMWDFPDHEGLQRLIAAVYESGGLIGAVSYGLAGLINVRLGHGAFLVDKQLLHGFNPGKLDPEACGHIPALLEACLKERGALFRNSFARQVEVSGRLISSQHPDAAEHVARIMVDLMAHHHPSTQDTLPRAS